MDCCVQICLPNVHTPRSVHKTDHFNVSTVPAAILVIYCLIFAWLFRSAFLQIPCLDTHPFYTFWPIPPDPYACEMRPFNGWFKGELQWMFTQDHFWLWSFYANILWLQKPFFEWYIFIPFWACLLLFSFTCCLVPSHNVPTEGEHLILSVSPTMIF
jgi:hypothetical protein